MSHRIIVLVGVTAALCGTFYGATILVDNTGSANPISILDAESAGSDAGVTTVLGGWDSDSGDRAYGSTCGWSTSPTGKGTYNFTGLPQGQYRIYATWLHDFARTDFVTNVAANGTSLGAYAATSSTGPTIQGGIDYSQGFKAQKNTTVDPTGSPFKYIGVGVVDSSSAGTLSVVLTPGATQMRIDAVGIQLLAGGSTWNGTIDSSWDTANNWTPSGAPNGAGVLVSLGQQTAPGSNVVDLGSSDKTVGSMMFSATSGTTVQSAGGRTLNFNNSGAPSPLTVAGSHSISAPIALANDLTINGSGTLSINGPVTANARNVTIGGGTLQIGNGGSLGDAVVTNNASLVINRDDSVTLANAISGTGSLTQAGAGTTTITGSMTYSGATFISNGTLKLGGGTAPTSPLAGALYWLDASNAASVALSGSSVTAWNDLSGNSRNFVQGTASRQPTYVQNALNGLPVLRFDGSDDRVELGTATSPQTVFIVNKPTADGGLRGIWGSENPTDKGIRSNGTGVWANPGDGNDFTNSQGQMWINGAAGNSFGSVNTPHVLSALRGTAYTGNYNNTRIGWYYGGRVFAGDVAEVLVYGTQLSTADRQAVENYLRAKWLANYGMLPRTTALSLSGGSLDLNGFNQTVASLAGTGGSITNSAATQATLTLNPASGSTTFAGSIANGASAVSLVKNGAGTQILTGANTFTGATTVNAGTLLVNGSGSLAGTVTVNNAGVFGGTGTVGGIIANSGGHVAPGASVGTLSTGTLSLAAGSILDFEFGAASNDLISVTAPGGLTVNGGGLNLYAENTTNQFSTVGTYNLFQYAGSIGGTGLSALSVLNRNPARRYTFGAAGGYVTLAIGAGPLWNGGGAGDTNWSNAANWSGVAPTNGDSLVYASGSGPSVNNIVGGSYGGFVFNSGSPAFTVSGNSVTLNGDGTGNLITNNSASTQTFTMPLNLAVLQGVNAASGPIVLSGNLSGAGGIVKTGANALTLNGTNSHAGGTTLTAGTLNLRNAAALGSGTLVINAGTLDNTIGSPLTLSTNNAQTWNGNWTFAGSNDLDMGTGLATMTANTTLTVNNARTLGVNRLGGAYTLTKLGTGTLALSGTGSSIGAILVNGGEVRMTGGSLAVSGNFQTGQASGSNGVFRMMGGTLTVPGNSPIIGDWGAGQYIQTLGSATINQALWVSNNGGAGLIDVSGGSLSTGDIYLGVRAGGTLNISGTGQVTAPVLRYAHPSTGGGTTNVNLNGGMLTVNQVLRHNGTANFNFNGGTLRANSSQTAFMTGLTLASVKSGGAVIDTQAYNVTIGQPLLDGGGGGGLTKLGSGTLTLSGASTYTGATTISAGTLKLPSPVGAPAFWLDASDISTLAQFSDGSTPVTAGGQPVGYWRDKTGQGRNATMATAGRRPTYDTTNTIGGKPVLTATSAASSALWVNYTALNTNPLTLAVVYQQHDLAGGNHALFGNDDGGWDRFQGLAGNSNYGIANGGWQNYGQAAAMSNTNPLRYMYLSSTPGVTNGSSIWINGTRYALFTENHSGSQQSVLTLNNIGQNDGWPGNVRFAEVIAYEGVLSDTQRQQLDVYLADKWFNGLSPSLPTFTPAPSTVLPATTNVVMAANTTFDLSGNVVTIGALNGPATARVLTGAGAPSLTVGQGGANSAFAGVISGAGSLTKTGGGTMTLSGINNDYTGTTTVSQGTLLVTGTHTGGGLYSVADGASLGGDGTIGASLATAPGSFVRPGTSIGTLTILGDATLGGTLVIEIDPADDGSADRLVVGDLLDITTATVDFDVLAALDDSAYVFASYGQLAGSAFAEVLDLPAGYRIDYNYLSENQIALVQDLGADIPEPATALLVMLCMPAVAARLRRRAWVR